MLVSYFQLEEQTVENLEVVIRTRIQQGFKVIAVDHMHELIAFASNETAADAASRYFKMFAAIVREFPDVYLLIAGQPNSAAQIRKRLDKDSWMGSKIPMQKVQYVITINRPTEGGGVKEYGQERFLSLVKSRGRSVDQVDFPVVLTRTGNFAEIMRLSESIDAKMRLK